MSTRRIIPITAIAVTVTLLAAFPNGAQAQQATYESNKRANEVHTQALAMLQNTADHEFALDRAAAIHSEAATLRTLDDPRFYDCVSWQSELLYPKGELNSAKRMMVRAADGALANGDVFNAGIGYARASVIASELELPEDVLRLAEKSIRLSRSPLLDERQRDQILAFFSKTTTN